MKYEVIKACVIKGTPHRAGSVVDLTESLATDLMAIGRVAPATDAPKTDNRSVGLDSSDAKPKKRKAPAKKTAEKKAD